MTRGVGGGGGWGGINSVRPSRILSSAHRDVALLACTDALSRHHPSAVVRFVAGRARVVDNDHNDDGRHDDDDDEDA